MKQYKVTSENITKDSPDDCLLPVDDFVHQLKVIQYLGGINSQARLHEYNMNQKTEVDGSNISITGNEKGELMKKHNIKPGTPDWFKLWFSLPYMTGEKPVEKKDK
jgi:hypothetical protein